VAASRKVTIEFLGKDVSAGKTASAVEQKFGKTGKAMDKVGRIAGGALLGGLALAGAGMVKAGQAAADDELAQGKLATAMRNNAGATDEQIASTEKWIEAQGKAFGVTDDELRPALGRLVAATKDVGKAQELSRLAMDVSAGTGKSFTQVTEAMAKAQNGNIGALGRLGVATKDAHGKTKTLKQVTKDMADTYKGQAAKAADTTAGKQKILTTRLGELGEKIGTAALPMMTKLSEIGIKMADWVSKNTTLVGVFVGVVATFAATLWAVSAAMRAWTAINTIAKMAQFAYNVVMMANPIGATILLVAGFIAILVIAYKKSETFRKIVNAAFNKVKSAANAVWSFIKAKWPLLLAILTGPFGLAVLAIAKNWDKIKDGAGKVVDFVKSIPDRLRNLAEKFGNAGKALIMSFVNGMKNAGGIISGIAGNVWDAVKDLLNGAIDRINSALSFKIDLPGPDLSVNSSIPHLAKGGIVTRPTVALIGEAGPEAVVPLRGRHAPKMTGGGGITVNINMGVGDPVAVGREVERVLVRYKRAKGNVALGFA
jgi:hypothetical protein